MEKLPYYAYMMKKYTPRSFPKPAPSRELFTFAKHDKWKEQLDESLFAPIKDLIIQYDNYLKLNRTNDTPETTAMIEAYIHREVGVDYREAVASACRVALGKIAPGFQAIRYAEALGRRDFIFDILLANIYLNEFDQEFSRRGVPCIQKITFPLQ